MASVMSWGFLDREMSAARDNDAGHVLCGDEYIGRDPIIECHRAAQRKDKRRNLAGA
jgi:hypothetical protein